MTGCDPHRIGGLVHGFHVSDEDVGQIDSVGRFSIDIENALSNPCAGGVTTVPGATWNIGSRRAPVAKRRHVVSSTRVGAPSLSTSRAPDKMGPMWRSAVAVSLLAASCGGGEVAPPDSGPDGGEGGSSLSALERELEDARRALDRMIEQDLHGTVLSAVATLRDAVGSERWLQRGPGS